MGRPIQDARERYRSFDLAELQALIRLRTGNLRRDKCRPYCIKKLMLLDMEGPLDDIAVYYTAPNTRPTSNELDRFQQMDYDTVVSSTRDLQDLIGRRTGDFDGNKCRITCLRMLRLLDFNQKFRFLDLIPEIRNMIYDLVLPTHKEEYIMDSTGGITKSVTSHAYPALLRANKQINSEATSYLFSATISYILTYRSKTSERLLIPSSSSSQTSTSTSTSPTTTITSKTTSTTTRPQVQNIKILLLHWCAPEQHQLAKLIQQHHLPSGGSPLKNLEVKLWNGCRNSWGENLEKMEEMMLPLKGKLEGTEVKFVGFGEGLERRARRVIFGGMHAPSSREGGVGDGRASKISGMEGGGLLKGS